MNPHNKDWSSYSNSDLIREHKALKAKLRSEMRRIIDKRDMFESALSRKRFGQKNNTSEIDSKALFAGNVGDIDKIIWPFLFQSSMGEDAIIGPNENVTRNITITQEAAFSLVAIQKNVFRLNGGDWEYVNPSDNTTNAGISTGLKFNIEESQTGVNWFDKPISIDHIGDGKDPYCMPSPTMFLPNSNTEINFYNQSANTYRVNMMFLGFRVRIEDAQNILSLVTE